MRRSKADAAIKALWGSFEWRGPTEFNAPFECGCCGHSPTWRMNVRINYTPADGWQRATVRECPACGWHCYEIYPSHARRNHDAREAKLLLEEEEDNE
jgi:hypothetical protein